VTLATLLHVDDSVSSSLLHSQVNIGPVPWASDTGVVKIDGESSSKEASACAVSIRAWAEIMLRTIKHGQHAILDDGAVDNIPSPFVLEGVVDELEFVNFLTSGALHVVDQNLLLFLVGEVVSMDLFGEVLRVHGGRYEHRV